MIGSEKVRAARKQMQVARLKEKEENPETYAGYFAALPKQLQKAKVNEAIRLAKQELRDAIEAVQIAEETGEDLLAAQEAAQIAALVVKQHEDSKIIRGSISLTSAQGASA